MRRLRTAFLLLLLPLVAACDEPGGSLEGSVSKDFSLEFDSVAATVSGCVVQVDYIKQYVATRYVPCHVQLDTHALGLADGSRLEGQSFLDKVSITRQTPTGRAFPLVASGALHFSTFTLTSGERLTGDFEATFEQDAGSLHGYFSAVVVDSDPSNDCKD
jgi:hypothetical protein